MKKNNIRREVHLNRQKNLNNLIEIVGSIRDTADKINMNEMQLGNLNRGESNMGPVIAKRLEELFGLPDNFFDYPHSREDLEKIIRKQVPTTIIEPGQSNKGSETESILEWFTYYTKLNKAQVEKIKQIINLELGDKP